jgi:3-hydroxyisobutyrate dehydrogenase-like beta-hydroxyacid dehydrogenase
MLREGASMSEVSVIGLGAMGSALATALLDNGHSVTVWNRTAAKVDPLVPKGAGVATNAAAAISSSPVVLVCVTDYEATRRIFETEKVTSAVADRILIQLTTGTPQDAREGEAWAKQYGADYLDGAIIAVPSQIGRPETPIFVSGPEAAFRQGEPLLRVLAGSSQHMGEAIGAASAWDLAVLSHFFGGLLGFYHGARIFESEGIRVDDLGDMLATIAPVIGEIVQNDGKAIQAADFDNAESSLEICWKGMELAVKQARESQINTDFPAFASAMFKKGVVAGYGEEKQAALIKVLREGA